MVDLEALYDVNRDDPTIIRTPAELDAVLDAVTEWDGRIIVDLFVAGDLKRPNLNVGVNGRSGRGALYYVESQDAWFSAGQPGPGENPVERLLYYYMNASTEFPGDCEIPLDVVRRAAHEYMTTGGQRPTAPTWKPAPEWW